MFWEVAMAKILSFFNQKGGVGKTTTVLNLGAALALKGKKVLVVDADPQGNLTSGLLSDEPEFTFYEVIIGEKDIKDDIVETNTKNLSILPGSNDSYGLEIELAVKGDWFFILRNKIQELNSDYDFIFIDCPPSLGILSLMSLNASDGVILPIQTEYYALEGVKQLMSTISLVRENYNSGLKLEGVLLTMCDFRNNLAVEVRREVEEAFGEHVFKTMIPRNVKLAEAPSFSKSIFEYDKSAIGATMYKKLAKEFIERFNHNEK